MSEGRNWGSTVLGWFIVRDEVSEAADGDPASRGRRAAAATGEPAPGTQRVARRTAAAFFQSEPPPPTAGRIDFEGVFEAAGISAEERQRVGEGRGTAREPSGRDAR